MLLSTYKNITLAYSNPKHHSLTASHFDAHFWQENNAIVGTSTGRRTTWFVSHDTKPWVLRHYWRGGLMAKFSDDLYCFPGVQQTRPIAEFRLLEEMHQLGLPVPKPIAAKIERIALWYRGDILIELIEDSKDLHAVLSNSPLPQNLWHQLGKEIARFHNHGVFHADLNIKNILLSENKFYLIDFDRGELRKPKSSWQQANMARLRRSFDKEKGKLASLHFTDHNWQDLLSGYQLALK
ncbi:3-deoxy-D-manno-octulosonic acid kinase [Shewanella sp. OPT22]|nr:3-deoxy-D-manno-octulosonic acid kinase [Shewanella sp. OPT22]